jgi:hypothetical protein
LASAIRFTTFSMRFSAIPQMAARLDGQVEIRLAGSFAAPGIYHDEAALRVLRQFSDDGPGACKAVRLPGIFAQENAHFTVLKVAMSACTKHFSSHPEFARFFLGQCVGTELHAQAFQPGLDVRASKMIALSAAAVVENYVPAMLVTYGGHSR